MRSKHGKKETVETKSGQPEASWKHLFSSKRAHLGVVCAALISAALTAGFKTVLAIMLGKIFDVTADFSNGKLSGSEALSDVSKWCVILVGLGIGNLVASTSFLALWVVFGELQAASARQDLLASLISRDMSWYDSQNEGISSLLVRIQTQTRELQLATSQVFGLLVNDFITSLASLAVAMAHSWKLSLVLLATVPISFIVLSLSTRSLQPAIVAQKQDMATASKHASASITAIDLVKVFGGYSYEVEQYGNAMNRAARHYLVQAQCNSIQIGYVNFWVVAMFVVGFWYGVALVNDGLNPGYVLTTFYATLASVQGIEALMPQWLVLARGMSAGAFLSSLKAKSSQRQETQQMKGSLQPPSCSGDIELTNVSFAYPSNPTKQVLAPSSFFFPSGDLTFIVGRSGSGKSTVGSLIVGFYEPLAGQVQIDGHPIQTLDETWVRENVTLIQQSSVQFNDTFYRNVALGHKYPDKVTKEEVQNACEAALLQPTLATLPEGLETNVGADGYNLSGGQKQRLALARARLRNSPVLILDEVTSGLDPVSKMLVMEAIRDWRRSKTTIIITHDVSQISNDDFVYVMDNASLVQEGFKRDLSRDISGYFAALEAANNSQEEAPGLPIQVNVISPTSPMSDWTSKTLVPGDRTSRVSQVFVEELENNALRPDRSEVQQRASLGAGTAYAFRLMTEQFWNSENSQKGFVLRPRDLPAVRDDNNNRRSRWRPLSRRFPTQPEKESHSLKNPDGSSIGTLEMDTFHEYSTVEPPYIFGGTESRENLANRRTEQEQTAKEGKDPSALGAMSLSAILKTLWPSLNKRDKALLLFGLFVCFLGGAASPAFSYCFAQLLGAMWAPGDKLAEGRRWAIYLIAIAVGDGLCAGGGRYLMEYSAQSWVNAIRIQALERILQQPKRWFEKSSHSAGRINECLDRNAEEMRNIVGRFVPIILTVTVMISTAIIWALAISWKLTLVAMAPLPLIMGAVKGYSVVSGKWEAKCNKSAGDSSATLTEIMLNIRVVKALALESHFTAKYLQRVTSTLGIGYKRATYSGPLFGLYQSLNYPMTALVFYYGTVLLAKEREITATAVLQVVNLLLFSIGSAASVLSSIPQITMAQATATQLLTYANLPLHPPSEKGGPQKPETPLPVRFNELAFSYTSAAERQVLRRVTFDVRAGDCLALVGPSGCGKSTVISLLLGLYTPSPSAWWNSYPLTFAGVPYNNIDVHYLRSKMAYVPQAPFLFPTTIAENIAYGLDTNTSLRSPSSIQAAAQAAGLDDFIASLPEGYNTLVGDGGQALSGGQSQRLCIARALIRKPTLLVLEEPTSALDAKSAEMIRQTIQTLVRRSRMTTTTAAAAAGGGMAILVVTHSREMMQIADRIVVLEDGTKVEEGTYKTLMMNRARFAHLLGEGEFVAEDDGDAVVRVGTPRLPPPDKRADVGGSR